MEERDKTLIGRMMPRLTEVDRSFFLAAFSDYLGYGSAKEISSLTGVSQHTISVSKKELADAPNDPRYRLKSDGSRRIRAPGGGRKSAVEEDPGLVTAIDGIIAPYVAGDPMNFIRWTTLSTRSISEELAGMGYVVSHKTVAEILHMLGYSLQQNAKYTKVSDPGPDRNSQFEFIDRETRSFISKGLPVISVDAKKKENVGNFKNAGSEYRPAGDPRKVLDHDFADRHAIPYGIYDVANDEGYVNVGISADTAEFAVESISNWWHMIGSRKYPDAKDLMITADCGGSNGNRVRLWKAELQKLADFTGLTFHVRHYPPGTSKWNKIEHRLFSFISMNWRAIPLESYEIIVNLIGSTKTGSGTKVSCTIDEWNYERGRSVSDEEYGSINIEKHQWRGDWNYSIAPHRSIVEN